MAYLYDRDKPCGVCVGRGQVVASDYGLAPVDKGEPGSFTCPRCLGKGMTREGLPETRAADLMKA